MDTNTERLEVTLPMLTARELFTARMLKGAAQQRVRAGKNVDDARDRGVVPDKLLGTYVEAMLHEEAQRREFLEAIEHSVRNLVTVKLLTEGLEAEVARALDNLPTA